MDVCRPVQFSSAVRRDYSPRSGKMPLLLVWGITGMQAIPPADS